MRIYEEQFLEILNNSVHGIKMPSDYLCEIGNVMSLSSIHNVLPLTMSAMVTCDCPMGLKRSIVNDVGFQLQRNLRFKKLYNELSDICNVYVLKGPICAETYPEPDLRISSDFDIFVRSDDWKSANDFLLKNNYISNGESYKSDETGLYIELHTSFAEKSDVFGNITDSYFNLCLKDSDSLFGYKTLSVTDNLTYLIYHAYKHFTGSGFGIRQILDISLYADKFNDKINYDRVFDFLKEINADCFGANVFFIAEKSLGFSFEKINNIIYSYDLCFEELICDILEAGVFGKSSEDRLHSSNIVGSAIEQSGKKSYLRALFPSYKTMTAKFRILHYLPVLLPLFWIVRIAVYSFKAIFGKRKVSPLATISIADSRIDLMKKLHIIK